MGEGARCRFAVRCKWAELLLTAHYLWATLLERLFDSLQLVCPRCGADMRIVARITHASLLQRIHAHIGEPS